MTFNAAQKQSFELRTIAAAGSTSYRIGSQFCPGNGWLLIWSANKARQLTLKVVGSVGGEGSLSATIVETADMSQHGLLALPWPVLTATVSCDSSETDLTFHAYGISDASGVDGWPSKIYRSVLKNVAGGGNSSETIPKGATGYMVTGSDDFDVSLLDQNNNVVGTYQIAKGAINVGSETPAPWRPTYEAGSVKVTNNGAGAEDLVWWFEYDLTIGSGLA